MQGLDDVTPAAGNELLGHLSLRAPTSLCARPGGPDLSHPGGMPGILREMQTRMNLLLLHALPLLLWGGLAAEPVGRAGRELRQEAEVQGWGWDWGWGLRAGAWGWSHPGILQLAPWPCRRR